MSPTVPESTGGYFVAPEPYNPPKHMTIRDCFVMEAFKLLLKAHIEGEIDDMDDKVIAEEAYMYANAMMNRREQIP